MLLVLLVCALISFFFFAWPLVSLCFHVFILVIQLLHQWMFLIVVNDVVYLVVSWGVVLCLLCWQAVCYLFLVLCVVMIVISLCRSRLQLLVFIRVHGFS